MTQLADYRPFVTVFDISDPYNITVESVNRFATDYKETNPYGFAFQGGLITLVKDAYNCDGDYLTKLYSVGVGGGESGSVASFGSFPEWDYGEYGADIIVKANDSAHKFILSNKQDYFSAWQGVYSVGYGGGLLDWRSSAQTTDGHFIYTGGGFSGYINLETFLPEPGGTYGFYVDNVLAISLICDGEEGTGWYQGWSTMAPRDYAISGNYLFMTSHYDDEFFEFPETHGFSIININDKENPQVVKWVNKPLDSDLHEPGQVMVYKGYAYVACNGTDKIVVYDVNDYYEWDMEWIQGLQWNAQALLPDGELPYRHDFGDVNYNSRVFGESEIIKPSADPTDWSLTDYDYRIQVSLDVVDVDTTVSGIPVAIRLDSDSDVFDHAQSNGYDIRFTRIDGTSLLYERVTYDDGVEATFFVLMDVDGTGDKEYLYLYYGYAVAGNESTTTIWDTAGYDIVFHFEEASYDGTASEIKDSTANSRDGYQYAGDFQPVAGEWGNYANFYDSGDKARLDADKSLSSSYTLSTMFIVPMVEHGATQILTENETSSDAHIMLNNDSADSLGCYDNWIRYDTGYDFDVLADGLHHVAVVRDGTTGSGIYYIDGEVVGYTESQPTVSIRYFGGSASWGPIDEFRLIDGVERSADWLMLEAYSLIDSDSFVTFGSEQAQTTTNHCIETYLYWTGTIWPALPTTTGWTAEAFNEAGASAATITNFTTESITFRVTCEDLLYNTGYQVKLTQDASGFSVRSAHIPVSKSKECNDEHRYLCDTIELCDNVGGVWYDDIWLGGWCLEP